MNRGSSYNSGSPSAVPDGIARLIGVAILVFALIVFASSGTYVVQPGFRGIAVTLGKVSLRFKPEGFGFKQPFVPRIQEAIKEVAASMSAEQIVKKREDVKIGALDLARMKIGADFLDVVDLVLYNMTLSPELEQAIELKMVQEQEAEKAKFTQLKAQIEADTAIIRAKGEAEAIQVRGLALRDNPDFIRLQILQNWNGRSPLVVGTEGGANMLLSLDELNKHTAPAPKQQPRTSSSAVQPSRSK